MNYLERGGRNGWKRRSLNVVSAFEILRERAMTA
jgi:hypothetical protein